MRLPVTFFWSSYGGNMPSHEERACLHSVCEMTANGDLTPPEMLFDLEESLSHAPMFSMALGGLLNDEVIIDLINGQGEWSAARRLRWLAGEWRLRCRRAFRPPAPPAAAAGQVLVTWRSSSPRIDGLLAPVVEELGPQRCTVIYEKDSVVPHIPPGAAQLPFFAVLPHEPDIWRPEFRRCWPAWKAALKAACRRYELSAAVYQRLAIELVHGSQIFVGCRRFLQAFRPAAVLTEFDRGSRWSCLVLAARSLKMPTFTLQHGVLGERAIGYVPLLAEKMFCWGETSREVLVGAGVPAGQIVIAGCPRLDRKLTVSSTEARARLGLDPAKPVVMLATAPYTELERVQLVEMFAGCMERMSEAAGIVRLHPSENLDEYSALVRTHSNIRFFDNRAATLDESIAASDVVVVHSSGVGSDALVKGRLTVVEDLPSAPLGFGLDLVEQAECPRAKTADELLAALRGLLFDDAVRRRHRQAADRFVGRFCAHFGRDAARMIAETVKGVVASETTAAQYFDALSATRQESAV
jgi:hypothetical protein